MTIFIIQLPQISIVGINARDGNHAASIFSAQDFTIETWAYIDK